MNPGGHFTSSFLHLLSLSFISSFTSPRLASIPLILFNMQFSQALLAALSLSASVSTIKAAPTRSHGHGHSSPMRQLLIRSNPDEVVERASLPMPSAVPALEKKETMEIRELIDRSDHIKDPQERSLFIVSEMKRQNIPGNVDEILQQITCLVSRPLSSPSGSFFQPKFSATLTDVSFHHSFAAEPTFRKRRPKMRGFCPFFFFFRIWI